ncbi:MAG: glycogen-binding domain-containing protein [Candidatus Anstonellales archaeon]
MRLTLIKVLIILNILIIIISLGVIYFRYSDLTKETQVMPNSKIVENLELSQKEISADIEEKSSTQPVEDISSQVVTKRTRKPKFVYFSSKAKKVALIGDFNNWTPVSMKKVSASKWELVIEVPEGRYLYNFLVDGKVVLDPNNKNSEMSKEGFKSSVLDLR